jgi:hypothetical protein
MINIKRHWKNWQQLIFLWIIDYLEKDMEELITTFIQFGNLGKNENIHMKRYDILYGEYQVESFHENYPDFLFEFYKRISFLKASWRLNELAYQSANFGENIDLIRGEVNIINYEEQKQIWETNAQASYLDPYEVFNSKEKAQFKNLILIDYVRGKFALCYDLQSKSKDENQLYFIDFGMTNQIRTITTSLNDYIFLGLKNKFFLGWQESEFFQNKLVAEKIKEYEAKIF